jgi:hypothetical protein
MMVYITDKQLPLAAGTYTITEINLDEIWIQAKGRNCTLVMIDAFLAKHISSFLIYPPEMKWTPIKYINDGDEVIVLDTSGADVVIYRCVFKANTDGWATEPMEMGQ